MPKVQILESHAHPKFPRLYVQLRSNSRFYQAVTYLDNKQRQKSLKQSHLPTAFKFAEDWYRRECRASVSFGMQHPIAELTTDPTMAELFATYRASLPEKKQAYANQKWGPIADFWRALSVRTINAATFRDFYKWRRKTNAKNHTIRKDVVLVRQTLKRAVEDEIIDSLPMIPAVGAVETNPRPWLTPDEWKRLLKVSEQRIKESRSVRIRQDRRDCHDLAVFIVHSMMRVGEALSVRFRDCRLDKNAEGEKILVCHVAGKRGGRTCVALMGAASVYERRLKAAGGKTGGLLFERHSRDSFRQLLEAADLYVDPKTNFERNYKALRATGISFRVMEPGAKPAHETAVARAARRFVREQRRQRKPRAWRSAGKNWKSCGVNNLGRCTYILYRAVGA